jgi:uncharacterized OsmC-like protein
MKGTEKIKRAFERNARAMSLRPSIGQGTATTRVEVVEGLTCVVADGPWRLTTDLGEKSGGDDRGPNPGVLGRAALGTCLAASYVMWAAKMDVPLDRLSVEVRADYDARGYHGIDGVVPGYEEVRYVVRVESAAPEEAVMKMLDIADANCDFLHVYTDPQRVKREVRLNPDRDADG